MSIRNRRRATSNSSGTSNGSSRRSNAAQPAAPQTGTSGKKWFQRNTEWMKSKAKNAIKPTKKSDKDHTQTLIGFASQLAISSVIGALFVFLLGAKISPSIGLQFAVPTFILAEIFAVLNSKGFWTPKMNTISYWIQIVILIIGFVILFSVGLSSLSLIYLQTNIFAIIATISFIPGLEWLIYHLILEGIVRLLASLLLAIFGAENLATAKAIVSIILGLIVLYYLLSFFQFI